MRTLRSYGFVEGYAPTWRFSNVWDYGYHTKDGDAFVAKLES